MTRLSRSARLVAFFLAVTALAAAAHAMERAPSRKTRLLNGLVLIVQEDHGFPLAAIQTIVSAGRARETRQMNGVSSLLAEVMRSQGTATTSGPALLATIEGEGSTLEVLGDKETLRLETSCAPELLEKNLRRHAELVLTPNLSPAAIALARENVLRNLARRADFPRETGYLAEMAAALLYGPHPYGLPKADRDVLKRLGASDVETFRASAVSPESMRIVVTGECEEARVLAVVQELYGKLAASSHPPARPAAPPSSERPLEKVERRDVKSAHVHVGFLAPSILDEDFCAMTVIEALLAQGRTSRLHRRLVTKEHLATSISSDFQPLPDVSTIGFQLSCESSAVEPAVQAVLSEIERLRSADVPADELERARTYLVTQLALSTQKRVAQAEWMGRLDLFGDPDLFTGFADRVAQVSTQDLRRAARRWLDPSRRAVAMVAPASAHEATAQRVWTGKLANGLSVVLHRDPSTTAVGITLMATIPPGAPEDQALRSSLLATLLANGHTLKSSSSRTLERLEAAGTGVNSSGDFDGVYVFANASLHNLDEILEILREVVFEPAFDDRELGEARRTLTAEFEQAEGSAEFTGMVQVMSRIFPGHCYGRPLQACGPTLEAMSLEDLRKEHRRLFVSGNITLALAGNITASEMMPRLEGIFGTLPVEAAPTGQAVALPEPAAEEVHTIAHPRGDVMYLAARLGPKAVQDFAALGVVFRVLGMGPDSLISRGLREAGILEEQSGTAMQFRSQAGFLMYGYRLKPGTLDQAREIAARAIESLRSGSVSAEQIESSRRMIQGFFVREFEDVLTQSIRVAGASAMLRKPEFYVHALDDYAKVTPEVVSAAASHLSTVRYVLLKKP